MGKTDVWQGTLALMVLKTLQVMGAMHGYGIARRIEQTSVPPYFRVADYIDARIYAGAGNGSPCCGGFARRRRL